jgi:hypothetical protein
MDYVNNILSVFKRANAQEITDGQLWYMDARQEAQEIADSHNLALSTVVGVIAALSPTNKWERNVIDANNICAAFVAGEYQESVKVCTYNTMRNKAWGILEQAVTDVDAIATMLKGPKITDFFLCIMGQDTCVIDGHAWGIANAERRNMQDVPNIGKRLRIALQEAYVKAGAQEGLTAYEMQAVTWVAWRRIHKIV